MLLPYPLVAAGLVWLSRSGGPVAPGLLVDAAVITGAAAIGGWLIVSSRPAAGASPSPGTALRGPRSAAGGGGAAPGRLRRTAAARAPLLTAAVAALVGGDVAARARRRRRVSAAHALDRRGRRRRAAPGQRPPAARPVGPVAVSPRRLAVFAVLAMMVPVAPALVPGRAARRRWCPACSAPRWRCCSWCGWRCWRRWSGRTARGAGLHPGPAGGAARRADPPRQPRPADRAGQPGRADRPADRPQRHGSLMLVRPRRLRRDQRRARARVGDALLMEVAGRLRGAFSGARVLARLGGDEFAVLRRGDGEAAARRALAALRPAYRIGGAGAARHRERRDWCASRPAARPPRRCATPTWPSTRRRPPAATGWCSFRPELSEALLRRSALAGGLRHAARPRRAGAALPAGGGAGRRGGWSRPRRCCGGGTRGESGVAGAVRAAGRADRADRADRLVGAAGGVRAGRPVVRAARRRGDGQRVGRTSCGRSDFADRVLATLADGAACPARR